MIVIFLFEKIKLIMIYKKKEFCKEYRNLVYFLKLTKNNLQENQKIKKIRKL